MKTYTKEQLEKGMEIYYKNTIDMPDEFYENVTDPKEDAIKSVEYLLKIIEENEI